MPEPEEHLQIAHLKRSSEFANQLVVPLNGGRERISDARPSLAKGPRVSVARRRHRPHRVVCLQTNLMADEDLPKAGLVLKKMQKVAL